MTKRIIILLILILFSLPVMADVMPHKSDAIQRNVVGLYQMPLRFAIYAAPDKNSQIVYQANWDYKTFNGSTDKDAENIFLVLIQNKELAYVQVTDYTEDWAEVIYDRENNLKGWIPTEEFRFMTWRSFYNIYGRKYGLYIMQDAPAQTKDLRGSTAEDAPVIQKLSNKPNKIKLTVIKGNWALITAIENNLGKTGYLRWRSDDGDIYAFPNIR